MAALTEVLAQLRALIRSYDSVLVCYSGGIDSALVLAVAHQELGERAIGLTAVSPSLPRLEREGAQRVAAAIGARHELVDSHELQRPGYVANGPDRCFYCKSELYEIAELKRQEWQLSRILNGTNKDDLGDHRPGLQAAAAAGVSSPLVALGLSKHDVRELAQLVGLPIWDKPASACLSSRIPYGTEVTVGRLGQIEALENALHELGLGQVRVRWHDRIARIEVPVEELPRLCEPALREQIVARGKAAGFSYVTLDLGGYRMGSHNEVLPGRRLPLHQS
jgi:pyridinium-3,5-biscarboxylic acid mononucleotide sulfurtransferase